MSPYASLVAAYAGVSGVTLAIVALAAVITVVVWLRSDAWADYRIQAAKDRAVRLHLHSKVVVIAEHLGVAVEYDDPFNLVSKGFRINGAMRYRDERISVTRVAVWSERHSQSLTISYVLIRSAQENKFLNVFESYGHRDGSSIEVRGYNAGHWEADLRKLFRTAEKKRNRQLKHSRQTDADRRRQNRDAEKGRFGL